MSGHGYVHPNPDGMLARCGGPGICVDCSREAAMAWLALREKMQDYEDGKRLILEEPCRHDEKHCSCVPDLRARIAELEAKLQKQKE